nr:hypothetical protein CFP56_00972 [Quercus suber]
MEASAVQRMQLIARSDTKSESAVRARADGRGWAEDRRVARAAARIKAVTTDGPPTSAALFSWAGDEMRKTQRGKMREDHRVSRWLGRRPKWISSRSGAHVRKAMQESQPRRRPPDRCFSSIIFAAHRQAYVLRQRSASTLGIEWLSHHRSDELTRLLKPADRTPETQARAWLRFFLPPPPPSASPAAAAALPISLRNMRPTRARERSASASASAADSLPGCRHHLAHPFVASEAPEQTRPGSLTANRARRDDRRRPARPLAVCDDSTAWSGSNDAQRISPRPSSPIEPEARPYSITGPRRAGRAHCREHAKRSERSRSSAVHSDTISPISHRTSTVSITPGVCRARWSNVITPAERETGMFDSILLDRKHGGHAALPDSSPAFFARFISFTVVRHPVPARSRALPYPNAVRVRPDENRAGLQSVSRSFVPSGSPCPHRIIRA